MKVASFFLGCGGLDLGFEQAGFVVVWANDNDPVVHETYTKNHPNTYFCEKDMRDLNLQDIPNDVDGFIGGPPCQSWSEGGKQRGLDDERGKMFLTYIHIIRVKKPKFFVIENVKGILSDKHFNTFMTMLEKLRDAGYVVNYQLMNSMHYHIPQERYRVIVVGFRNDIHTSYHFPEPDKSNPITLRQAIGDITESPREYISEPVHMEYSKWLNHDIYIGAFDQKYMARNRVRSWEETSFTIQAQARNCPLHPQAPKMIYVSHNKRIFKPGCEHLYRRLSVRECARIQTFPDHFKFYYHNICDGYKMVGNAVPPRLGKVIALSIKEALTSLSNPKTSMLVATYRDNYQLSLIKEQKIYYVRAGFRPGAMQFPKGAKSPHYLMLHKGKQRMLFRLKETTVKLVSKEMLQSYGFIPSGDLYWIFQIENIENACSIDINSITLPKGSKRFVPYIINI